MTTAAKLFTIEYVLFIAGYPIADIKEAAVWIYQQSKNK